MRLKDSPTNHADYANAQYAEEMDGKSLPCLNLCVPDPTDTSVTPPEMSKVDKCKVLVYGQEEWVKCVPIARVDSLRQVITDRRIAQGVILKDYNQKMDQIIQKISSIKERFEKHKTDREL